MVKPHAAAPRCHAIATRSATAARRATGTSPRATTRVGEANIGRILDAALTDFARLGFAGARIDRIAEAAGLSKTNLLYYFRSKEELYLAVLTRTLEMWLEPLRELGADREPEEELKHYIERKLDYSRSHPEGSRLFAMEIMQGAPMLSRVLATDLAELVERKIATIQGWIEAGKLAPIEPCHLIFHIWATTQHYADFAAQIRTLTGRDLGDEAFLREAKRAVVGTILRGVLPRSSG